MNTLFLADLIKLIIRETEISNLQFPENSKLTYLDISGTKISDLQFPENSKLKILYIKYTNIRKLNLTNILTLEEVECSYNQKVIANAGVTKNTW